MNKIQQFLFQELNQLIYCILMGNTDGMRFFCGNFWRKSYKMNLKAEVNKYDL